MIGSHQGNVSVAQAEVSSQDPDGGIVVSQAPETIGSPAGRTFIVPAGSSGGSLNATPSGTELPHGTIVVPGPSTPLATPSPAGSIPGTRRLPTVKMPQVSKPSLVVPLTERGQYEMVAAEGQGARVLTPDAAAALAVKNSIDLKITAANVHEA